MGYWEDLIRAIIDASSSSMMKIKVVVPSAVCVLAMVVSYN